MNIPTHIRHMAVKNAELMKCTILIYLYHDTYVMMPIGYSIPVEARLIAYMTKEFELIERNGNEKADHATAGDESGD